MPNTLAHLGLQGLATRAILPRADLKWLCLGCVIPDIPWILQRVARGVASGFSPYEIRLYAIVQSSLAACLLLCAALAFFSVAPRRVFGVLALNSMLHLGLDALQTKWANGVHLFAPLSWSLTNVGLFWPESAATVLLTAGGLVYLLYAWRLRPGDPVAVSWRPWLDTLLGSALLLTYLLAPLGFLSAAEAADSHSIRVLRERADRPGREVGFDRAGYLGRSGGNKLRTFSGEELALEGWSAEGPGAVSLLGRFIDEGTVRVSRAHRHWPWFRDMCSGVGLALVGLLWLASLRRGRGTVQRI